MDQNYVNYGYTPVYHQLQSTGQEPLPHFHHLTARTSASSVDHQHQPLPSIANFTNASQQQPCKKLDQSDEQGEFGNYQRASYYPAPPPLFNSHQFQPMPAMWDNNFTYPSVIPQYSPVNYHPQSFMHHRAPPAMGYPNFMQSPQNVQVQVIGASTPQSTEELHNCDICKRDFTSAAHLKRHVLTKAHVKAAVKSAGCINLSELQERAAGQDSLIVKTGDKSFQVTFTELQGQTPGPGNSITDLSEAEVVLIDNIDKELSAIEPSTLASFEMVDEKPSFLVMGTPSPVPQAPSSSSSENGEFHCGLCNKTFAKRCYFTQHNKTAHAGLKPFKCAKCGKKFNSQPALDEHVQKHGGVKPFKCTQCVKSFNFKTDLKRHVILHTTEKPHVCQQCGKGFIRNDHLLKHLMSHKKKMEKLKRICSVNGVTF